MVKLPPCTSRSAAQEIHQQLQNLSAPGKIYHLSLRPGSACWTELYNNGKIKHFLEEKSPTWNSQKGAQGAHITCFASLGQEQPHKGFPPLCCQQSRNKLERERHGILEDAQVSPTCSCRFGCGGSFQMLEKSNNGT